MRHSRLMKAFAEKAHTIRQLVAPHSLLSLVVVSMIVALSLLTTTSHAQSREEILRLQHALEARRIAIGCAQRPLDVSAHPIKAHQGGVKTKARKRSTKQASYSVKRT